MKRSKVSDFTKFVRGNKKNEGKIEVRGRVIEVNGVSNYTCIDCNKVYCAFVESEIQEKGQSLPEVVKCSSCGGPAVHLKELDVVTPEKALVPKKGMVYFKYTEEGPEFVEV